MILDNYNKETKRFDNLDTSIKPKKFRDILKWKFSSKRNTWPKKVEVKSFDIPPLIFNEPGIRITYVGHVTFLIQVDGINILTDPVWSDRVSPFNFIGPKRIIEPGIKFRDLPKIDYILVSHNHYDHLDLATIKLLVEQYSSVIITPVKNDKIILKAIPNAIVKTLKWGEDNSELNSKISFYLEPAQHWSARGLFDYNKCLWGSFIIKTKAGSICFIGDSGYHSRIFKNIGNKFDNIILSLIPIGACEPRWFMKDVHMNPEEAIQTYFDLKSKFAIATHFNIFQLADDDYDQPNTKLLKLLQNYNVNKPKFLTCDVGQVSYFI